MAIALKHKFTSSKADGADPTLVQPSNWNDDHELTLAQSRLLGRFSTGGGAAEEIGLDSLLEFSGGNLRLANAAALSVLGRSANSAGQMAAMAAATSGHVLRRDGTALGFGQLLLDSFPNGLITADKMSTANGGFVQLALDGQQLQAGFTAAVQNDGTKSSGTYTPTPVGGNYKLIVRGGAFTFAAPTVTGDYQIIVKVGTGSGASTVTFTGFTKVDGASLVNTSGQDYLFVITKVYDVKHLMILEAN